MTQLLTIAEVIHNIKRIPILTRREPESFIERLIIQLEFLTPNNSQEEKCPQDKP